MNKPEKNPVMKLALKTETLKIYKALLRKTPDRLEQGSGHKSRSQKNISVYEYLAIPTFVRHGKTIDAGY